MNLPICEIETHQFVKSTNWHFQDSMIWPHQNFNLRDWKLFNLSNRQIDIFMFQSSDKTKLSICPIETFQFVKSTNRHIQMTSIWPNETLNLWNRNFSMCQIDKLTFSSFIDLTESKIQVITLKLWNLSHQQIEIFKCQQFDPINLWIGQIWSFFISFLYPRTQKQPGHALHHNTLTRGWHDSPRRERNQATYQHKQICFPYIGFELTRINSMIGPTVVKTLS